MVAGALMMVLVASADVCAAQDPIALTREGTVAIETHRFGDALEAFTRAAALQPDASFCFGAGVAAFMLGRDEVARSRFECALALDPAHLPAAVWLGDLHYRAGRLHDAISTYEAARKRWPGDIELQEQLGRCRKELELQSRFRELRTERFRVRFEADTHEPLAHEVVERLEAAYWRIGNSLGLYPTQPITVVLYTREQFAAVTRLAAWSAAAYDGRIHVPIDGTAAQRHELDRVLSHELVHAVVAMAGGRAVPAWLNEGLATVFEPAGAADAEATLGRAASRPTLAELHRSFVGLDKNHAEIAYASAARAAQRLLEQRGAPAVVALLEDLARGAPFASAFHARIDMPYDDFAALVARD